MDTSQPAKGRNAAGDGQLDFAVSRAMFGYVEWRWEAPDTAELAALDGVLA